MINAMDAIKKTLEESKFEVTQQKMKQLISMPKIKPDKPKPVFTSCSPGPVYNVKSQSMRNLRDKYVYIKSKPELIDYTARNPSPLAYKIPRENNMPSLFIHPKLKDPRQPISQTPNTLGPGKYRPEEKKIPKLYQKQISGTELKMTNEQCYTRPFLQMKSSQPGPGSYNLYESYKKAAVTDRIAPTFKLRPGDMADQRIQQRSPSPADYEINEWLYREKTARRSVLPANVTFKMMAADANETMRKAEKLTSLEYVENGLGELNAREKYQTIKQAYADPDHFKKLGETEITHYTTRKSVVNNDDGASNTVQNTKLTVNAENTSVNNTTLRQEELLLIK